MLPSRREMISVGQEIDEFLVMCGVGAPSSGFGEGTEEAQMFGVAFLRETFARDQHLLRVSGSEIRGEGVDDAGA